jgi:predicted TIM-barrel fold metal-dependent hydrolase
MEYEIVSADSHITEPADLWVTRLDKKFRSRAPDVITLPDKPGAYFRVEGIAPQPVSGGFAAGKSGSVLVEHMKHGYELARPGGWDPVERIKDQDTDGVAAEVLYPSNGLILFRVRDAELQEACFDAYNDWIADFCAHDPSRLIGIGLVSLADVPTAVRKLEEMRRKGLRGAAIWSQPPPDRLYNRRGVYEQFWEAASELRMPISMHVFSGYGEESDLALDNIGIRYTRLIHEVQRSLLHLVFGGVLARFPELKIVSVENDTGWIPHFLHRIDHAYERYNALELEALPAKPSDYVKRQVFATFQDDPIGAAMCDVFGEDNYMWGSDFPHIDSTWPNSRAVIDRNFASAKPLVKKKIMAGNALRLYGLN